MNMQFNLRQQVEAEIERLLVMLDAMDGDTDLEPSLAGYSEGMDDSEGGEADDEPSLCGIGVEPGDDQDREFDPAESGIGDADGLLEMAPMKDWRHEGVM